MSKAFISKYLISYWISFPDDENYPVGFGVTAFSVEEAYTMLEDFGYNYHLNAQSVVIKENIKWEEIPYCDMVHPNMGPMVVRGVWYPHLNSR